MIRENQEEKTEKEKQKQGLCQVNADRPLVVK